MITRSVSVLSGLANLSLAWAAIVSTPAVAHTYERYDTDGDHNVRIECDRDGDECWKQSEYHRNTVYNRSGQWVCDSDGDRCHYVYNGREWKPRHWDHDEEERHDDHQWPSRSVGHSDVGRKSVEDRGSGWTFMEARVGIELRSYLLELTGLSLFPLVVIPGSVPG
jgi:hypothetical protein